MIASSTTMPMAIVSASSVKLLIENPRKYMMANVATIDAGIASPGITVRSEEHTSELQSQSNLVCRLLLEKKKKKKNKINRMLQSRPCLLQAGCSPYRNLHL